MVLANPITFLFVDLSHVIFPSLSCSPVKRVSFKDCIHHWLHSLMAALTNGCTYSWLHSSMAALINGCTHQWLHSFMAALIHGCTHSWLHPFLSSLLNQTAARTWHPTFDVYPCIQAERKVKNYAGSEIRSPLKSSKRSHFDIGYRKFGWAKPKGCSLNVHAGRTKNINTGRSKRAVL
jgi:hypothetical protein